MANGAGDSSVGDGRVEKAMKQEGSSSWENNVAADAWSQHGSNDRLTAGLGSVDDTYKALHQFFDQDLKTNIALQGGATEDKGNWLEGRVQQRHDEMAKQFGLDPAKASWEDILQARGAKGNQENDGRVERLRQSEASRFGLDPAKASWEEIDKARVDARKAELEGKYGHK
jgi:hypothetical protein